MNIHENVKQNVKKMAKIRQGKEWKKKFHTNVVAASGIKAYAVEMQWNEESTTAAAVAERRNWTKITYIDV